MAMSHDQADTIRILDKKICYTNALSRMTKKCLNKGQKGLAFRPLLIKVIQLNLQCTYLVIASQTCSVLLTPYKTHHSRDSSNPQITLYLTLKQLVELCCCQPQCKKIHRKKSFSRKVYFYCAFLDELNVTIEIQICKLKVVLIYFLYTIYLQE